MEELIVEDIMIPTSEIIGIDTNQSSKNAEKIIESAASYDAIKIKKRPQSIHPIVYRLLHLYYLVILSHQIIGWLTLLI